MECLGREAVIIEVIYTGDLTYKRGTSENAFSERGKGKKIIVKICISAFEEKI